MRDALLVFPVAARMNGAVILHPDARCWERTKARPAVCRVKGTSPKEFGRVHPLELVEVTAELGPRTG